MLADRALESFSVSLRTRNSSELTISAYQTDLIQFLEYASHETGVEMDTLNVTQIDKIIIRSYLGLMTEKQLSRKSIARKLAALRSFFKFLCREEIISQNPVQKIHTPKLGKSLPRFLFHEHMDILLDAADMWMIH